MSALLAHPAESLAALGLVLLVLASMARRFAYRPDKRRRAHVAMDERIRARLEATIWPD
jgi:hypothetical protein